MRRTTLQQALLPTLGAAALVCLAIVTDRPARARPPRQAPPRSAGGPCRRRNRPRRRRRSDPLRQPAPSRAGRATSRSR